MSVKGFVLIETAVGKTKEVYTSLQKIKEVKSVDAVTGPYDIIIIIEGANPDSIASAITTKVHEIHGVNRTVTCLCLEV